MTQKQQNSNEVSADNETVLRPAQTLPEQETLIINDVELKPASLLSDVAEVTIMDEPVIETESLLDENNPASAPKASSKWFLMLAALTIIASIAELSVFIIDVFQQRNWLSAVWLSVTIGLFIFTVRFFWQEWRGLKTLRNQQSFRHVSEQMFQTSVIGLAENHCMKVAEHLPAHYRPLVVQWQSQLQPHLTDTEVLSLYEQQVLGPIDKLAIRAVTNNASAAAVMIALSPFALLDMAFVFWRNIKMMSKISDIYGVKLGYWGKVRLIKNVFHTMIYAGASELVADAGNYALGAGITGKLSSSLAQGLGGGVLTARIGLKAMQECRPMPCLSITKPSLTLISKQVLEDLRSKVIRS